MTIRLPADTGFRGSMALREARATKYHDVYHLVREAFITAFYSHQRDKWVNVEALFATEIIVKKAARYMAYPYQIDDNNQVTFGEPKEVVATYAPVGVTNVTEAFDDNANVLQVIEADGAGKKGGKFLIKVIEAGMSRNSRNYPASVLKDAASMFNGVRVFNKADSEHLKGEGKSLNNLIGDLSNARFVEAKGSQKAYVEAQLTILESASDVAEKMVELHQTGKSHLFGFSIDADANATKKGTGANRFIEANKFVRVNSVDVIIEPGAGGVLLNVLEAYEEDSMLLKKMLEALDKNAPQLLKGVDREDEQQVLEAYGKMTAEEAVREAAGDNGGETDDGQTSGNVESDDDLVKVVEARMTGRMLIRESKLPDVSKERLLGQIEDTENFTEAMAKDWIKGESDYLARITDSGKPQNHGDYQGHNGASDGSKQMLEALFDPKDRTVMSVRECYLACTGDDRFTGRLTRSVSARMLEALDTTSLSDAFGEAMHKRMMDLYKQSSIWDAWRLLVDIVPVSDFRNQERISLGGYGDLQAVAESGAYPGLSSPTDNKQKYAVTKRGGTEKITLEMMANDDVSIVTKIPGKMVKAAKRTLARFVFDFFKNNPNLADGNPWFHASRGNLGANGLDSAGVAAARLFFMNAKEPGSDEELGLPLKYLLVSAFQEETAFDLFKRDTNNDETFIQSLKPTVIPVPGWKDPNDWVATTDPQENPLIELGFFQGREEPELFVQDAPTHGSMFTNDEIKYKIRHIYGGSPLSEISAFKNVVV